MRLAEVHLALRDVACERGGRLLFEHLSLTLGPGEAAVVTGPNGAGKSSLLRIAAGLLSPSSGSVERSCRVALADDAAALDERMSLRSALNFWTRMDGSSPDDGMVPMGLMPLSGVPVQMLSAGQKKRAVLARVIASGAALWLLDEPSNGLDADGLDRLSSSMAEHRRLGGAILAASHLNLGLDSAQRISLA